MVTHNEPETDPEPDNETDAVVTVWRLLPDSGGDLCLFTPVIPADTRLNRTIFRNNSTPVHRFLQPPPGLWPELPKKRSSVSVMTFSNG